MQKPDTLTVVLAVAYVGLIVAFTGSNVWLLDVGQISHEHQTPVTPADYAFSIWFLIWTLQGVSVLWLLARKDAVLAETKKNIAATVAPWWIGGFVSELSWLWCFAQNTPFSLTQSACCLMTGAFCFLYALFTLESNPGRTFPSGFKLSFRGCVAAASATNAAWLTVASAVGITMLAPNSNEAVWLGILIAGAAADLGLFVVYRTKSISYALTLVWAFVAVFFAQSAFPIVQAVAVLVAVVFAAAAGLIAFKRVRGNAATEVMDEVDALLGSAV